MKGLASLIRLHKSKLEGRCRHLAELEAVARNFTDRIRDLESKLAAESRIAGAASETGHVVGSYVQASLVRKRQLEDSVVQVQRQIDEVRAEVSAAFQKLKRFEVADERQRSTRQAAARRRERLAEDEIGMNVFRRGAERAG